MQLIQLQKRLEQLLEDYPKNKLFKDMLFDVNNLLDPNFIQSSRLSPLFGVRSTAGIDFIRSCQNDLKQRGTFKRLFFYRETQKIKQLKKDLLINNPDFYAQLFFEKLIRGILKFLAEYLKWHLKSIADDRRSVAVELRNKIMSLQIDKNSYMDNIGIIFKWLVQVAAKIREEDSKHCSRNFLTSRLHSFNVNTANKILLYSKKNSLLKQTLAPYALQELMVLWEEYVTSSEENFNFKHLLQVVPKSLKQLVKNYQVLLVDSVNTIEKELLYRWDMLTNAGENFDFNQLKQKVKQQDIKEYQKLNMYEDLIANAKKQGISIQLSI